MRSHSPFRLSGAVLVALILADMLAPRPAAAQNYYSIFISGQLVSSETIPLTIGPVPISGGVGSTGTASGEIDPGSLRTYQTVSNPISGLFTPQIEARCVASLQVFDITCPQCPADAQDAYNLILHTRLNGSLSISSEHPYAASLDINVSTGSTFVTGSLSLTGNGVESSGLLAGAPTTMVNYPLDIPIVLYMYPTPFGDIFEMTLDTRAGGTALGTEVNTATADFNQLGWSFPLVGPVFSGLPPGATVNCPSLNIVDNHWLGPNANVGVVAHAAEFALTPLRNPVRGGTTLTLSLPVSGIARVEIFDVSGARVATLLDGWQVAGSQQLKWDAAGAPAGVYFARATMGAQRATARLVRLP